MTLLLDSVDYLILCQSIQWLKNGKCQFSDVPKVCFVVKEIRVNTNKLTKWYALRVPYGREMKLKTLLDSLDAECFIPMHYKLNQLVPAIRNLIFVHAMPSFLNELKIQTALSIPFRYIMDKATNRPIVVPDRDMANFIAVAGTLHEQLIYLSNIEPTLKTGDKVHVIGGIFEGVTGLVVRLKKDRRVLVSITNLVAVATAHINPLLLKKIDPQ